MATVNPHKTNRVLFDENSFPLFKASFTDELRHQLIDDDLMAGRSVSGVLIAIVTMGLLIGIVAVVLCL